MAVLKNKDIKSMGEKELQTKLEELKLELIKKNMNANKLSKIKTKEIKKAIARILTIKNKK